MSLEAKSGSALVATLFHAAVVTGVCYVCWHPASGEAPDVVEVYCTGSSY